jgi:SAM-dependent methyltransferase
VTESEAHWQRLWAEKAPNEVSWFQARPALSLELVREADVAEDAPIIDVGGGASALAGELLRAGYTDVTVADVAASALQRARADLGERADEVEWVVADVRNHRFARTYELWHDRAVFHFMVEEADRLAYLDSMRSALRPGGHLILVTFGPQGPSRCSGLPVARYGAESLGEILGPEFGLECSRFEAHRTPSGAEQQFVYARFRRAPSEGGRAP